MAPCLRRLEEITRSFPEISENIMMKPAILQPVKTQEFHLVIEPSHSWLALDLGDLWRYRELLFFLTWRDIMVRYKQTLLSVAGVLLRFLIILP